MSSERIACFSDMTYPSGRYRRRIRISAWDAREPKRSGGSQRQSEAREPKRSGGSQRQSEAREPKRSGGSQRQSEQPMVSAELEDDFHHFRVTVAHDGARVTGVRGVGVRFPWSTCPLAADRLAPLVGMPLSVRSTAVGDVVSARDNCTHMFDLAGLAVAHAARVGARRQYDVVVADPVDDRRQVTLDRDGEPLLAWVVDSHTILEPVPFRGQALRGGFLAWA